VCGSASSAWKTALLYLGPEKRISVVNGNVESDVRRDVLKLAVIDRHTGSSRIGLSFASGLKQNIMREIGGGIVVVDGEKVEQWELSLVGIHTAAPFAEAQREFRRINQAIRNLGCPLKALVLALSLVALQTNSYLRPQ
jgi:adenine deaminase